MRRDLRGLSKEGADWVAAHLVAAGALADEEPETAWRHARAARARGGRIGVVRETVGLVAYRAGEWAEAIGELRAARRMGGGPGHLAVMADCERALEHPEKAIELSRSAEADELDPDASIELSIVVAGARSDLGQIDAALAHLERIGLDKAEQHPRLAYAYADLLLKAGRGQEGLSWFIRSADVDNDEETDALDRVAELADSASLEDGDDSVPVAITGTSIAADPETTERPDDVQLEAATGALPPVDDSVDDAGVAADLAAEAADDAEVDDDIVELTAETTGNDGADDGSMVQMNESNEADGAEESGGTASSAETAAPDGAPALLFSDDQQVGELFSDDQQAGD